MSDAASLGPSPATFLEVEQPCDAFTPLPEGKVYSAAFHEAGHAFVAFRLRIPFDTVKISCYETGDGGLVQSGYVHLSRETITFQRKSDWATVFFAGMAAQRLFGDEEEYVLACGRKDRQAAGKLAQKFFIISDDISTFLRRAERRAAKLVGQDWFAKNRILELAIRLSAKGEVSGREVRKIFGSREPYSSRVFSSERA